MSKLASVADVRELIAEWGHNDTSPENVSLGSNKKMNWVCPRGHEYPASVKSRARGSGCPYCSGRKVLPGFNDVPTTHPELIADYAGDTTLSTFSAGSNTRVQWRCHVCGHEWMTSVANRALKGHGCPVCSGNQIRAGVNDFATLFPDLDRMRVSNAPVASTSTTMTSWRCMDNPSHTWEMSVRAMRELGHCPMCEGAGRRVVAGFNDVGTKDPELVAEWADSREPSTYGPGSDVSVLWRCSRNPKHEWTATINSRVHGSGCPYCSGRLAEKGLNDLATLFPELAQEVVEEVPENLTRASSQKVLWHCRECGHEWTCAVSDRTRTDGKKTGCPRCASRSRVSKAESELAAFIHEILPQETIITSDRSVIPPKELDIYVPGKHIAVEFNGLYWHGDSKKGRRYHYDKWKQCSDQGIQLLTIWEDQWRDKRNLIEDMLRHKLGVDHSPVVGARSCEIVEVSSRDARTFLDAHHVQGWAQNSGVGLGLAHDGNLVAVMTLRRRSERLWELSRYATSIRVPGGQSRLLRHFLGAFPVDKVITFSDHEVSDGALYERTGWTYDGEIPPDYRYVIDGQRRHKFGFRIKKFRNDPCLRYVEGLTESELAELNGIERVWDCGKTRWVWCTSHS